MKSALNYNIGKGIDSPPMIAILGGVIVRVDVSEMEMQLRSWMDVDVDGKSPVRTSKVCYL